MTQRWHGDLKLLLLKQQLEISIFIFRNSINFNIIPECDTYDVLAFMWKISPLNLRYSEQFKHLSLVFVVLDEPQCLSAACFVSAHLLKNKYLIKVKACKTLKKWQHFKTCFQKCLSIVWLHSLAFDEFTRRSMCNYFEHFHTYSNPIAQTVSFLFCSKT